MIISSAASPNDRFRSNQTLSITWLMKLITLTDFTDDRGIKKNMTNEVILSVIPEQITFFFSVNDKLFVQQFNSL